MKTLVSVGLPLLFTAVVACSSNDTSTGSSSTSTSSSSGSAAATNCNDRCATKARSCGAPEQLIASDCSNACAGATEEKVTCLEQTSSSSSGSTGGQCVAVGSTGCDASSNDPSKKCCNLAACQLETKKCCFPTGQPLLHCTSSSECCSGTCQDDPKGGGTKYCQ